jgi:hypothetical protein
MPYIALWSRLDAFERAALETALLERTVVRATLMRSTLHLVAATDFPVFDAAVRGARMAVWGSTARKTGTDLTALHAALLDFCPEPRTVEEMEGHLETVVSRDAVLAGVPGGVRHGLFRMASAGGGLVHVPPSGSWGEHGRPRYVAARAWLREPAGADEPPDAAHATAGAVERYLGAYGPASQEDVAKWLGQPRVGVLREAVAVLADRLTSRSMQGGAPLLDLVDRTVPDGDRPAPPRFLARWDSVLIGYQARERILPPAHRAAVIKKNGDFLPTFLVDGWVAGLWSVETRRGAATIRLEPFGTLTRRVTAGLEEEADRLVRFIAPEAQQWSVEVAST